MLLFFKKKCHFCKKKMTKQEIRFYYNDIHKKVAVCSHCVTYAERRAYRKA